MPIKRFLLVFHSNLMISTFRGNEFECEKILKESQNIEALSVFYSRSNSVKVGEDVWLEKGFVLLIGQD